MTPKLYVMWNTTSERLKAAMSPGVHGKQLINKKNLHTDKYLYSISLQGYLACLTLHAPTQSQRTAHILSSVGHEGSLVRTADLFIPGSAISIV